MKRIVITGVGAVSPLGNDVASLVEGIEGGKSAVRSMPDWKDYGLRCLLGAPAELLNEKSIPRKSRRSMGRISIFAVQAVEQALADARVEKEKLTSGRVGCIIGSTMGGASSLTEAFEILFTEKDISKLPSMKFFQCVPHTAAMNVAQYLGINGYVLATSAACASAMQAIGVGADLIRLGKQDIVVCGGAEELHYTVTGSFDVLYATSYQFNDRPQQSPRPFDADRDGLVCGEGCGIVVLEEYEAAVRRNARIYAEIVGYSTGSSGGPISQSNAGAIASCMSRALDDAGILPEQVQYINAHATATIQGDREEAEAIRIVFGDSIPVSTLKGHIGHTLGASGSLELIVCLAMMEKSMIFPTLNLKKVSEDCEGIMHVKESIRSEIDIFVKNSFAFGGINASLVCKRVKRD